MLYFSANSWKLTFPCINNTKKKKKKKHEPRPDKTNKVTVRPAKTQISLGIAQSDQSLRRALNG